jgi:hypothetical protein
MFHLQSLGEFGLGYGGRQPSETGDYPWISRTGCGGCSCLPQISLRLAFPHNSMLYMTHPWRTKLQEISTSAALNFFDWVSGASMRGVVRVYSGFGRSHETDPAAEPAPSI